MDPRRLKLRNAQICASRNFEYAEPVPAESLSATGQPAGLREAGLQPAGLREAGQREAGQPAGLRERKKLATREALGFEAMRLAVQRGLDNVHVEDIAAAAGVSPRTFNNYFSSKYEAICSLAMERGQRVGEALRARPADEPLWDAITHAVLHLYAAADEPPRKQWIAGVRLVISSPELQGEYLKTQFVTQQALAEAIAERTGADLARDMFPTIMAGAVNAATQTAMERWLFADPPIALAPLIRLALRQLTEGLPSASTAAEVPSSAGAENDYPDPVCGRLPSVPDPPTASSAST
jgi:AcrR family transcriptional regulator